MINMILEFIHLIASEANEICEKEAKKTIAPEHVLAALKVSFIIYKEMIVVIVSYISDRD
jgi:histone H3/H4